jgi:hypothetical protein
LITGLAYRSDELRAVVELDRLGMTYFAPSLFRTPAEEFLE